MTNEQRYIWIRDKFLSGEDPKPEDIAEPTTVEEFDAFIDKMAAKYPVVPKLND
jgi:hypothetical protein